MVNTVYTCLGLRLFLVCPPGLPTPCVFVSAVAGTNGKTLWERPLAPDFQWAQCGLKGLGGTDSGCLLSHADQLTAIDKYEGD